MGFGSSLEDRNKSPGQVRNLFEMDSLTKSHVVDFDLLNKNLFQLPAIICSWEVDFLARNSEPKLRSMDKYSLKSNYDFDLLN